MALFRGAGGSGTSTAFGLLDEVTQQALLAQNASALATQAINSFDSFDDRYLGSKTSDPTLDNDGNTLLIGALYFNSLSNDLKVYTGSAWIVTLNSNSNIDAGNF